MVQIIIGGVTYSKADAINIMKTPTRGLKTYTMFKALVAARLNVILGNDDSCIADTIAAADAWMEPRPVGSGVKASSDAWRCGGEDLYDTLDAYNNSEPCCALACD